MTNAILITRPNYDPITTYLFHWTIFVIKEARQKSTKVLDLKGDKANNKTFTNYMRKHDPALVFFNGHGDANSITGDNEEVLVQTNQNDDILVGKIVYARSCDAGDKLGPSAVAKGTTAFIGYKKKFAVGYTPSKTTRPLADTVAKLFIEPSNLVPISLLKGNKVKDAYRKSQEAMFRNIQFMLSTKATSAQKDGAPYLWVNRKYQVTLGDQEAHI